MRAIDFLKEHNIPFKISGDEVLIGCVIPDCPNQGQEQMYINIHTGSWYCHRCNTGGKSIKSLGYRAGLITFQEPVQQVDKLYVSPLDVERWAEDLYLREDAIDYLTDIRGFSLDSIAHFKLGWRMDGDLPCVVIPYFDETQTCTGYKKYYYTSDRKPKCKFEKDSAISFYNGEQVDYSKDIYITEGEFDAITLWQYGIHNVGSVPNGANSINGWAEKISKAHGKIMACTDNDKAGQECAERIGDYVGRTRCFRVFPRLKDYNEYLQCELPKEEIEKDITNAVPMYTPVDASTIRYLAEAVEIAETPEKRKGFTTGWADVDRLQGGWRMGEISVLTGETGNGKSAYSLANVRHWLSQGHKVVVFSGEMSGADILIRLASNQFRRTAKPEDVHTFAQVYKDKLFIPNIYDDWENETDQLPIPKLFNMIDYYVDQGVTFFVIDHMHCFIRKGKNLIEDIEDFMTRCRVRVKTHPIHLYLVAQCRKKDKDKRRLTKDDLYGSSEIDHASWNIWVIHRDNEKDHTVELKLEKNRSYGGVLGSCFLQFDMATQCNYYEVKK